MKYRIEIDEETGNVLGVYSEVASFEGLGEPVIKKVSNIDFNNDTKKWEVKMVHDESVVLDAEGKGEAYEKEVELVCEQLNELSKVHFG